MTLDLFPPESGRWWIQPPAESHQWLLIRLLFDASVAVELWVSVLPGPVPELKPLEPLGLDVVEYQFHSCPLPVCAPRGALVVLGRGCYWLPVHYSVVRSICGQKSIGSDCRTVCGCCPESECTISPARPAAALARLSTVNI